LVFICGLLSVLGSLQLDYLFPLELFHFLFSSNSRSARFSCLFFGCSRRVAGSVPIVVFYSSVWWISCAFRPWRSRVNSFFFFFFILRFVGNILCRFLFVVSLDFFIVGALSWFLSLTVGGFFEERLFSFPTLFFFFLLIFLSLD